MAIPPGEECLARVAVRSPATARNPELDRKQLADVLPFRSGNGPPWGWPRTRNAWFDDKAQGATGLAGHARAEYLESFPRPWAPRAHNATLRSGRRIKARRDLSKAVRISALISLPDHRARGLNPLPIRPSSPAAMRGITIEGARAGCSSGEGPKFYVKHKARGLRARARWCRPLAIRTWSRWTPGRQLKAGGDQTNHFFAHARHTPGVACLFFLSLSDGNLVFRRTRCAVNFVAGAVDPARASGTRIRCTTFSTARCASPCRTTWVLIRASIVFTRVDHDESARPIRRTNMYIHFSEPRRLPHRR